MYELYCSYKGGNYQSSDLEFEELSFIMYGKIAN